jgi:hypothetical protein
MTFEGQWHEGVQQVCTTASKRPTCPYDAAGAPDDSRPKWPNSLPASDGAGLVLVHGKSVVVSMETKSGPGARPPGEGPDTRLIAGPERRSGPLETSHSSCCISGGRGNRHRPSLAALNPSAT